MTETHDKQETGQRRALAMHFHLCHELFHHADDDDDGGDGGDDDDDELK